MTIEPTRIVARYFSVFKRVPFLPWLIDEQLKVYTLFVRPAVFSKMTDAVKAIKRFDGVETRYHKYGGLEFRTLHKEFCHLHGDGLLDVLLTRALAEHFIREGICTEHHVNVGTGWISLQIVPRTNVNQVVAVAKCASDNDCILVQHDAHNRKGFAEGAVMAAEWIKDRKGFYNFADIFSELTTKPSV